MWRRLFGASPANKPTKDEFETCRAFVQEELRLLQNVQVVVALGKVVFDEYLRTCNMAGQVIPAPRPKFSYGAERLTRPMFHQVFSRANNLVEIF